MELTEGMYEGAIAVFDDPNAALSASANSLSLRPTSRKGSDEVKSSMEKELSDRGGDLQTRAIEGSLVVV